MEVWTSNFSYDQVEIPQRLVIGDVEPRSGYRLFVQEGILTERLKVAIHTEGDWMDKVFKPNYALMPLKEVSAFIAQNGHLPDMPSAACMVEDGLDVAKMDAVLLLKIEELTLYLIDIQERLQIAEGKLKSKVN